MRRPSWVLIPAPVQATASSANNSGVPHTAAFQAESCCTMVVVGISHRRRILAVDLHPADRRHDRPHRRCRRDRDGIRRTRHRRPPRRPDRRAVWAQGSPSPGFGADSGGRPGRSEACAPGWRPDTSSTQIGVHKKMVSDRPASSRSEAMSQMRRRPMRGSCPSVAASTRRT
jgi:hypothetical protein